MGIAIEEKKVFLYVRDVARILGFSEQTIRSYADQGILKSHRSPYGWRLFTIEEIEKFRKKLTGGKVAGDE